MYVSLALKSQKGLFYMWMCTIGYILTEISVV